MLLVALDCVTFAYGSSHTTWLHTAQDALSLPLTAGRGLQRCRRGGPRAGLGAGAGVKFSPTWDPEVLGVCPSQGGWSATAIWPVGSGAGVGQKGSSTVELGGDCPGASGRLSVVAPRRAVGWPRNPGGEGHPAGRPLKAGPQAWGHAGLLHAMPSAVTTVAAQAADSSSGGSPGPGLACCRGAP